MALKCTHRRMAGGAGHEHIEYLWYQDDQTNATGVKTRAEMVAYVKKNGNESVWCPDSNPLLKGAWVHTNSNGLVEYVQTVADKRWTDNLLNLPTA